MKLRYILLAFSFMLPFVTVSAQQNQQDKPMVFSYVEQMPQAGYDWNKYISENLRYPDSARMYNIEGRVIAKFIVNEDGSISDVSILRGIGGGCDEEVLRFMKSVPRWKPGMQNGKAVKVYFTQPMVFKLEPAIPAEKR